MLSTSPMATAEVARADWVRPVLDQQTDDPEILALRRKMQRRRRIAFIADIRISPTIDEALDDGLVSDAKVE